MQAQKELSWIEREDRKADKHKYNLADIARQVLQMCHQLEAVKGTPVQITQRMLGIRPEQWAALKLPPS